MNLLEVAKLSGTPSLQGQHFNFLKLQFLNGLNHINKLNTFLKTSDNDTNLEGAKEEFVRSEFEIFFNQTNGSAINWIDETVKNNAADLNFRLLALSCLDNLKIFENESSKKAFNALKSYLDIPSIEIQKKAVEVLKNSEDPEAIKILEEKLSTLQENNPLIYSIDKALVKLEMSTRSKIHSEIWRLQFEGDNIKEAREEVLKKYLESCGKARLITCLAYAGLNNYNQHDQLQVLYMLNELDPKLAFKAFIGITENLCKQKNDDPPEAELIALIKKIEK